MLHTPVIAPYWKHTKICIDRMDAFFNILSIIQYHHWPLAVEHSINPSCQYRWYIVCFIPSILALNLQDQFHLLQWPSQSLMIAQVWGQVERKQISIRQRSTVSCRLYIIFININCPWNLTKKQFLCDTDLKQWVLWSISWLPRGGGTKRPFVIMRTCIIL